MRQAKVILIPIRRTGTKIIEKHLLPASPILKFKNGGGAAYFRQVKPVIQEPPFP
jgi:hypothetical protein